MWFLDRIFRRANDWLKNCESIAYWWPDDSTDNDSRGCVDETRLNNREMGACSFTGWQGHADWRRDLRWDLPRCKRTAFRLESRGYVTMPKSAVSGALAIGSSRLLVRTYAGCRRGAVLYGIGGQLWAYGYPAVPGTVTKAAC
jgi:hypothetical protein